MKMEMKMIENDQWEMPDTVHHSSMWVVSISMHGWNLLLHLLNI